MGAIVISEVLDDVFPERETYRPSEISILVPAHFRKSREEARWSPATRTGFRFAFVYLILYIFPSPLEMVPLLDRVVARYGEMWNKLVPWMGKHFLGVNITVLPNGSGDTTFNYVQVLCFLVLAAFATLLWSLLDTRRTNYQKLYRWLKLYVQIALGAILIFYGAMKVIQSQMPPPQLSTLLESYGDSSPMGLLWTFMGASRGYNAFAGGSEMLAGLLLMVPGLTTLGALMAMAVMTNVFILNMCYDVPVKLFSFHLLLMAVFLAAPDLRRLAELFVLKRKVRLSASPPLFRRKWLNRSLIAAQLTFALAVTTIALYQSHQFVNYGRATIAAPLYGLWSVEEYKVDGIVQPPLLSEEDRWQRVIFDRPDRVIIEPMNGPRLKFRLQLDAAKRSFSLGKADDSKWQSDFTFQNPLPNVLLLSGGMDGHSVSATLRHVDLQKSFLLTSRGFHWVNEYPFRR